MSTTPELEAVARAICIENLKATKQPTDDGTVESYWNSFVPEARAALRAVREPTAGMQPHMYHGPITDWQKTIDYITSEPS